MVYSILSENGMDKYYQLNANAGSSQKSAFRQKYAFLDDELTISKLISYQDEQLTKVQFYIPEIHCSSCLWLLENIHLLHPGVQSARVDFIRKEAQISFRHQEISLRALVELLASIGYPPHIILKDLDNKNKRPVIEKSLYYKLGLAGFAFGNIMLFSFPEYLGLSHSGDETLKRAFAYLNMALIMPVLLYSGRDYFRSAWQGLRQKHLNIDLPVSLGIAALFLRSAYEILSHTGAGYLDSLAGLIFFLLIGKWFQQKTYAQISFDRDFKSYFPIACTVLKNDQEIQLTLDKLQIGDIVLIRHGELIPADGVLETGDARIDYSFVTGESALVDKSKNDLLYAGGRQMGGMISVRILKTVSNSYLTQLWNDQAFDKSKESGQTSQIADKVARFFTAVILIVSLGALFYWLPKDSSIAINAFTAVLIVACPCAVALSIPFTFGNVLRVLASKGIYLRNTGVIEQLAKIKHVVFDKTGTITNVKSSQLVFKGKQLSEAEQVLVYSLVRHSTHPLSRQIERQFRHLKPQEVNSFIEEKGKGISGFVNGALVRIGSQEFIGMDDAEKAEGVYVEIDNTLKGYYEQKNRYRKALKEVIASIETKFSFALITGDNDRERERLEEIFPEKTALLFNQKPSDKLDYIKDQQAKGHEIAMVGDGLNDAGALQQSEIGIVISEDTSNFTPACDIIMDARQFKHLPTLFEYSRISIRIVMMAYLIALIYNIIGLSYAVQGLLSPVIAAILMPLSSVTIVVFGVVMSTLVAKKKKLF
jgi:Cu+-exporting ATPase